MAKKFVYQKSEHGIGDFVYVDLLPEVKRPRQFNVNVIGTLFYLVILVWILIFVPITQKTAQLQDLKSWNNDLHYEYTLAQEEFVGYEINLDVISFEENIQYLEDYKIDFNNLKDDVELEVVSGQLNGEITSIVYSAETQEFYITVEFPDYFYFNTLNHNLLNLPWVISIEQTNPQLQGNTNIWSATFALEVNPNVE